jgi:glycerophosphoryl diester phosphodiesterase
MHLGVGETVALSIGCYICAAVIIVRLSPFRRWSKDSVLAHLRKRFPFKVMNISHRGGCLIGPENTIFTFRKGVSDFGVDMLEMDVNESADGEIVVSHDLSLARVCATELSHLTVKDLVVGNDPDKNLPQVARHVQLHFGSSQKDFFNADDAGHVVPVNSETRFPLLREVFDALPGVPIHLDIKYPSQALTENVIALIEEYKREAITIVGTAGGNSQALNQVLHAPVSGPVSGGVQTSPLVSASTRRDRFLRFASFGEVVKTYLLYYLGILPLVPLDFDVFSIPLPTSIKGELLREQTKSCVLPHVAKFLLYSPTLWVHLQRRGILVLGFVLNDAVEFEEASHWPINGIMTDDPRALHQFLSANDISSMYGL